jgi:oxygen-independent coproporphyrinogen-3 oxidase
MTNNFAPEQSPRPVIGAYVHFPWCLKKCPYCDFLSVAAAPSSQRDERYADAVLAELRRRVAGIGQPLLGSVFFGGGTPSLWDTRALSRVLDGILQNFPSDHPEITVECNPTSFDERKADELLAAGVNRVSIGVQSLDAARLRFLGRLHDEEAGPKAVETALRAGFPRVSGDLIFGVAGQESERAAAEARTIGSTGLTHLSAYALTIEPGTQFGALARKGQLPLLGDDAVAESFAAVDAVLEELGFEHYEISNFARSGHRSRHNVGYWLGQDYLGLGCGAWGTVTTGRRKLRYRNTPNPERYLDSAVHWESADVEQAGGESLVHVVEELDAETVLRERLMLGLRLAEGIDIAAAARALQIDPWNEPRKKAADRLIARGRLEMSGARLRIPKESWLFADGTIAELI